MMKKPIIILLITTASITSGCAPVMVCGGAAAGTAVVREKTFGESITDTQISTKLKWAMMQHDLPLLQHIGINVQNGEVLLTGAVPNPQMHLEAVRLAWDVQGV